MIVVRNSMPPRSAITKLQSDITGFKLIYIVDMLIVAMIISSIIIGGYNYYVESLMPEPLGFQVTDLTIPQNSVQFGTPVHILVTVNNAGKADGNHSVTLTIDDVPMETKTIQLSAGENSTIDFTATEIAVGNHTVMVGDLTKELIITLETQPKQSEIQLTDLGISRTQAKVGETITVTASVTNIGDLSGSYSMVLFINDQEREIRNIQLEGGETKIETFEVVEETDGEYLVKIGDLTKSFTITSDAPPPKPAEFITTELVITPNAILANEIVDISVKVTNVGEESGSYSVDLKIDGAVRQTKTVTLPGGATIVVKFEVTETNPGTFNVEINSLNGSFTVEGGSASEYTKLLNMYVKPYENWNGDTITVKADATNLINEESILGARLVVNDEVIETKSIQLPPSAASVPVEFKITAGEPGSYPVKLINLGNQSNTLAGFFIVVPDGFHTLIISANYQGMVFTLNDVEHHAPYIELLEEGTYTITAPVSFEMGNTGVNFTNWQDGSTSLTRTISLTSRMTITANYQIGASCPSLYVWNGTEYLYRGEVSDGPGWLGLIDHFREDGTAVFASSSPWDYIKLEKSQLQPRNGYYDMTVTQKWDEISYSDAAKLLVVDHSPDVDVFSNKGDVHLYDLEGLGTIYTISKNPSTPISAVNGEGEDVLSQISNHDGVYTTGHTYEWDTLELNLGDLSGAKEIKLVVAGITIWPSNEDASVWVPQFLTQPGVQPLPMPYIEVKDENRNWVSVPDSRQFPYLPVVNEFLVVNLTGLFPTNDSSLRIHNFYDVRFDYVGVDTTPQQNLIIQEICSIAELTQAFTTNSNSTGNFTRYGDVTPLLRHADDEFVIIRQGDQIHLMFPIIDIEPVPENMERDYFLFYAVWFKSAGLSYLTYAVDPLPFHEMSAFPYPPEESYPYDEDHLSYLLEYNTRIVAPAS